ncbi:MAG: DUF2693 domain-containing protein [Clostridia bacterium]|nr:DUF2693 domain-containing protein [Clostridia bacterium]
MSTRASVIVRKNDDVKYFYRHSDGHTYFLGEELDDMFVKEPRKPVTFDSACNMLYDELEPTDSIHGDENYAYVIDVVEKNIKCYELPLSKEYHRVDEIDVEPEYVHSFANTNLLNNLKDRMKKEIVAFKYTKSNGEIRQAVGTLNSELDEDLAKYELKGINKNNDISTVYWDVNKKAWRTFKNENLIEIYE